MTARQIIALGTLVYLLTIPFFFHPDIKTIFYLASYLSFGVVNIYQYVSTHPDAAGLGQFVYPPFAYLIMGTWAALAKILAGSSLTAWLAMGNDAVEVEGLHRYLLVLKGPQVLAHALTAMMLIKLVDSQKQKNWLAWLWFFNPVSIYTVALMGQIDGWAVMTMVAAVVIIKKHPYWAAMLLGIGGAIKSFPLLVLPLVFFVNPLAAMAGVAVYVAIIAPFLTTPVFWTATLASGLSLRVVNIWVLAGLTGLYLLAWRRRRQIADRLSIYVLAVSLILLAGIKWHPQWLLWMTPWLCLYLVTIRKYFLPILLGLFTIVLLAVFPDKFLSWGLMSGIDSAILFLPAPISFVPASLVEILTIVGRAGFAVVSLGIIYQSMIARHD